MMRYIGALAMALLPLAGCNQAMADSPKVFNLASYSGGYGYATQLDFPHNIIGLLVVDGMGHGIDTRSVFESGMEAKQSFHCTYSINPDGTGSESCVNDADHSVSPAKLVLVAGGAEVLRDATLPDGSVSVLFDAKRQ